MRGVSRSRAREHLVESVMSWNDGGKPPGDPDKELSRTSWVAMPTRKERAATPAEPSPAWSPPAQQPAQQQPQAHQEGAPFGAYQASGKSAAFRRSSEGGRFWAVLGVLVLVMLLAAAATWLALAPR